MHHPMVIKYDTLTRIQAETHQVLWILKHLPEFTKSRIKLIHHIRWKIKHIGEMLTEMNPADFTIMRIKLNNHLARAYILKMGGIAEWDFKLSE